ncbi:MAG: glucan biosynthesis protein, partial [Bacteroidota bacterium]
VYEMQKRIEERPFFLFVLVVPLYFYESLLEPFFEITHNLIWDWFNFVSSLTLFFYGFLLISLGNAFWKAIDRIWKFSLLVGLVCFSGQLFIWNYFEDSIYVHFTEALLKVVNLWSWILVILGIGSTFLNHNSRLLSYANTAVYTFYILHQTATIIIAYWIYDKDWGLFAKFLLLSIGTFLLCFLTYEFLIRRIKWLYPLFGLKIKSRGTTIVERP